MRLIYLFKTIFRIIKYLFIKPRRYSFLLLSTLISQPKSILEVGVYNGKRAIELIEAAKIFNENVRYYGFDLFEDFYKKKSLLIRELSKNPLKENLIFKKLSKYKYIYLFKGDSKVTLKNFLNKKIFPDLIFIDGGHAINTIRSDWNNLKKIIKKKTIVIFDDFYLADKSVINKFGCNKIIKSLNKKKFKIYKFFIGDVFFDKHLKKYKKIFLIKVKLI